MAATLPPLPPPPDPSVQRFTPLGKPTLPQVDYERRLNEFLKAVKAALEST